VWRRARLDAISQPDTGTPVIVDYKTTRSADLEHISRCMHLYGYAMQAAWYQDGAYAVGLTGDALPRFLFVFQEVEPPHLVTVVEPDTTALYIGGQRNREAIEIYADCTRSGIWPGHVPLGDIPLVGLPGWAERQYATDNYEDVTL
jgi:hypothetical protein